VLPLMQAGRLKGLAVSSRARSPLVADLPGMGEAGLADYDMSFWYGFFVPAGTPAPVIKRIFEASAQVVQLPAVRTAFAREGTETATSKSPEDFSAFVAEDAKFWVRLVRDAKITVD
jgi:tripartite-type tricarboxylate transporter receptor subunit TctC